MVQSRVPGGAELPDKTNSGAGGVAAVIVAEAVAVAVAVVVVVVVAVVVAVVVVVVVLVVVVVVAVVVVVVVVVCCELKARTAPRPEILKPLRTLCNPWSIILYYIHIAP